MAELQSAGYEATARQGESGQFDVLTEGRLVFSKRDTGRFPEGGEVRRLLAGS